MSAISFHNVWSDILVTFARTERHSVYDNETVVRLCIRASVRSFTQISQKGLGQFYSNFAQG